MKTLKRNIKLKKLFLILIFLSFVNSVFANCASNQININTASAEELDKIYGVGPKTAPKIINSRPFNSLDELINVSGIGEFTLQKIKDQGLACVENSANTDNKTNESDKENKSEFDEAKKINTINTKEVIKKKDITLNKINLNSKDINTYKNNSWVGNYTLYGLIIFSILIIILLIIKTRNKNEFR
ncbi:hypothetical protein DRN73_03065 [Candidatus Pacearchaeota archaeon]|nr:MAG: hypothetical protein DRN73_03065 [Candidatus Pacearchaeota archaeon]